MVLHKSPKKGGIGAGGLHRVDHVVKVAYAPAGGLKGPKQWVVPIFLIQSPWERADHNGYSHGIV